MACELFNKIFGSKKEGTIPQKPSDLPEGNTGKPVESVLTSSRYFDVNWQFLINQEGLKLVQHFEACFLHAYLDSVKVPTIGWGRIRYSNGQKVKMGDVCTQAQADQWLLDDLYEEGAKFIRSMTETEDYLSDDQFSALMSFTYNRGCGRYDQKLDDLCDAYLKDKVLDAEENAEICKVIATYNYAGSPPKYLLGLDRRRWAEIRLFQGRDWREFDTVAKFTAFKNRGYK